jgi:class 3 adenylate cyclase
MGVWEAGGWEEPELERVLATVLFTDIVGASERRRRQPVRRFGVFGWCRVVIRGWAWLVRKSRRRPRVGS